jgi:hypothetical protein
LNQIKPKRKKSIRTPKLKITNLSTEKTPKRKERVKKSIKLKTYKQLKKEKTDKD